MKKAIATMMLLAGGLFAAPAFRVGIGFGTPAPVGVVRPAYPGSGYTWVDGYYAPNGVYVEGYWAPPAFVNVAPRYAPDRYYDRDDHYDRDRRFDRDNHFDRGRSDRDGRSDRGSFDRGRSDHFRR